jgi:Transcriptional regulator SbtR-like, C-terminal domain
VRPGLGPAARSSTRRGAVWLVAGLHRPRGQQRALALAIPNDQGGQRSALFERWHAAMHATASALLTRARQAGAVRADLEVADLLALATAIALTGADTGRTERLLDLVRRGTDPTPASRAP